MIAFTWRSRVLPILSLLFRPTTTTLGQTGAEYNRAVEPVEFGDLRSRCLQKGVGLPAHHFQVSTGSSMSIRLKAKVSHFGSRHQEISLDTHYDYLRDPFLSVNDIASALSGAILNTQWAHHREIMPIASD